MDRLHWFDYFEHIKKPLPSGLAPVSLPSFISSRHSEMDFDTIKYKDKLREKQRQLKLKIRAEERAKMDVKAVQEQKRLRAKRRQQNEAWCVNGSGYRALVALSGASFSLLFLNGEAVGSVMALVYS